MYSPRIGCLNVHTVDSTVSSCPFEQYWLPDLAIVPVSNKSFESTFRRHLMKSLLHLMIPNPQTQSCPQPIHKPLARSYKDSQTLSYEDIPSTGSIFNSEHFERCVRLSRQFLRTNGVNNWMVTPHTVLETAHSA